MRTHKDIKRIVIQTEHPRIDGWVVSIDYKDSKFVNFSIDPPKDETEDMLALTYECIKRQMKSSQKGFNAVSSNTK